MDKITRFLMRIEELRKLEEQIDREKHTLTIPIKLVEFKNNDSLTTTITLMANKE